MFTLSAVCSGRDGGRGREREGERERECAVHMCVSLGSKILSFVASLPRQANGGDVSQTSLKLGRS
jgi:hypothetical protein